MYEPDTHITVARTIRRHSSNRLDLRELVAEQARLGACRSILDLGCGFGSFYEILAGRLQRGTRVVGMDSNPANRDHFLARVRACGGTPEFICTRLTDHLAQGDLEFDLVLSFFSLYFFPGILPSVRRVLKPDGVFLAVTHCSDSFVQLISLVPDRRGFEVLDNFHDGNGGHRLREHFSSVQETLYPNQLVFPAESLEDLLLYLEFKRPLWLADHQIGGIRDGLSEMIGKEAFVINKSDVVFRCTP